MALSTPEDICNAALNSIGWSRQIADLYEGSPAARVALSYYGQIRDAVMARGEWPFCLREVALTANGQTAPSPWAYEYNYPSDCLRIRYVKPGPLTGGTRSTDPQPVLFRPFNDQRTVPASLCILSDLANAILTYNARVVDPSTWVPGFTETLIGELAKKLAFGLFKDANTIKARIGLAQQSEAEGMMVDDMAPPKDGSASGGNS